MPASSSARRGRPRIVLVGGGHAHALVLATWAQTPPDADVVLIAADRLTPYSGMLPGHVAGHYGHALIHVDLERLAQRVGAPQ